MEIISSKLVYSREPEKRVYWISVSLSIVLLFYDRYCTFDKKDCLCFKVVQCGQHES